jgi:DNA-binding transcriptional LysR family regulator
VVIDRKTADPLDLTQLRTFLAVYRAGSLSAAAPLVNLSQSTVTAQVQALETRLGRRLFERRPRGVAPTPAADDLAARLAGPMDALQAVAGGTGSAVREPPVSLAGPAEFLATTVVPRLGPVMAAGVRLHISTGLADDLLAGMRAGFYDLVVSSVRPRGNALIAEPLGDEDFVLVAAPDLADGLVRAGFADGPGAQEALLAAPLIAYANDLPILRRYWRHVFGVRLVAEPALVIPDLRAVKAAVLVGLGFTVMPRYLCADELAAGSLRLLLDPEDAPINTAFLVQRAGAYPSPHVALVRDHLLQLAKSL